MIMSLDNKLDRVIYVCIHVCAYCKALPVYVCIHVCIP